MISLKMLMMANTTHNSLRLNPLAQVHLELYIKLNINYKTNYMLLKRCTLKSEKLFHDEIQNMEKLDSKFVVKYHEKWNEGQHLYLQMEYCSQTLRPIIESKQNIFKRKSKNPMNIFEYFITCEILLEILQSVQYLHSLNIIHRDLKPENIMVVQHVNSNRCLILGECRLATEHERTSMSHTQRPGNVLKYMATEVQWGRTYDVKADVYSLGVIGHELFDTFGENKLSLLEKGHLGKYLKQTSNRIMKYMPLKEYNLMVTISVEKKRKVLNEVKCLEKLDSKFVVKYYKSWTEGKHLYIQMEYCTQTLKEILQSIRTTFERQSSEPMNIFEYFICCEIFRELLECVQYIHEIVPPIIHRDIKPENVLILHKHMKQPCLKIGDLGLATDHKMTSASHTKGAGTVKYMAPEVHFSTHYKPSADIYSLGLIGQELFETHMA
ncbi:unnamed protein product [Medioppia subpectinata]|uniref:Protein kinase domain-containing protein n=1 Tax=Medioppia subpectinata TaxID=1979941 RepID=A0A7R9KSK4_9ACAR|nr:unnamed protein product [Medioppia subpectinata]CAG2108947.1 unnamed protein product [Medioppia subpectinata]